MIELTMKEQRTSDIMVKLIAGEISVKQAMKLLGLSKRHTLRKKKDYIENGIASIPHKSRGKPSGKGYSQEIKDKIVNLYREEYYGWNFHHFTEALINYHNIKVSISFIYRLLKFNKIESPLKYKQRRKSHPPRARKEYAGELVQCDASQHQWFYGDKTFYYLHGAIDDATGIVTGAYFCEQETIYGYQMILMQTIKNYGLPERLFTDYRTIFQSTKKELSLDDQLKGKKINNTRFVKMLMKLGVGIISTANPRAKGRIERLWRTLQDRLYKELTKFSITTIKEANDYLSNVFLPKYNSRFASTIDFNRNLFVCVDDDFDFNTQLALWHDRKIYHNCYITLDNKYYVILDDDSTAYIPTKSKVSIYTLLDGSISVLYKDTFYKTSPVDILFPIKDSVTSSVSTTKNNSSKAHTPSKDHPWKNSSITKNWSLYKNRSSLPR